MWLALILSATLPAALPYAGGPPVRSTGAPGDLTCAQSGCHTGSPLNSGGGSASISFPAGLTYTPGERQRWAIRINDAAARTFGFQVTARLASNLAVGQAGKFASADADTIVLCDNDSPRVGVSCPGAFTVEFVEHVAPNRTGVFIVDWTPPLSNVGEVRIFLAGIAADGNGTHRGDRTHTRSYTMTPSVFSGTPGALFVPMRPCRLMDTRLGSGQTGNFGAPGLAPGETRTVSVPVHACGVPFSAVAYALNITVVPLGPLGYLTVFPTGQGRPVASTLNSDDGRVLANATIVAAGLNGAIDIYATNWTEVIVDIAGYFAVF